MGEIYSFGAWVRRRRKALDLTQEALARQVGCAQVTIRRIEADERRPSRELAALLAQHLEIPPQERAAFVRAARAEQAVDQLPGPALPAAPQVPAAGPSDSGTLTFLFTDIEGSTRLWDQHPAAMKQALVRHDALLRQAIETHGGHVFKAIGDAFCAAFHTAHDALAASLEAQRALHAERWGQTGPIRVRMALHTGVTEQKDGDYFGPVLNRVARLLSAGHGGQVLLSAATQELVRDGLPEGVSLRDMGQRRLRDLTRPEQVYQLVVPDLPAEFPPLKMLEQRRTNLPVQPTALIGRERELAQLSALLRQEDVRLVTLTGFGGTGKTRLALQLAAALLDDYPDGVFFVDLAPIRDPQLVVPAIAQVVGVKEQGQVPLLQVLQHELRSRRRLLLLDNFEQVVAAAPMVAELLQVAPSVKLLVTSRVVLKVRGEQEYPVPPLALPDLRALPPLAQLTQYEALRLFIERARNVKPDFAVTTATAPTIAEICHRLDGLPLAIELAAARMRILPPEQLLQRLGQRLRLLTGGARDLPQRQQTLRAAIDWSYALLQPEEQRLFRRLGVFAAGCSLEAVEALCQGMGDITLDVLDGLAALAQQSLLRQDEVLLAGAAEPRFVLLETLREYAMEQLGECGELHVARQQHAAYYLALAQQSAAAYHGPQQGAWLERMEREHDNLRAALTWALAEGHTEVALDLAGSLRHFWLPHAHLSEGRRWCARVLALTGAASPAARGLALRCAGLLAWAQGAYAVAQGSLEQSLTQYRAAGNDAEVAAVLSNLGMVARGQGALSHARSLFEESFRQFQVLEDLRGMARVNYNLGNLFLILGDTATAQQLFEDVLLVGRRMQNYHYVRLGLTGLADVAMSLGQYVRAQKLLEESMDLARSVSDHYYTFIHLELLGRTYFEQDAYLQARQLWEEGLRFARKTGSHYVASLLSALGLLAAVGQDYAHARACYRESLSGPRDVGNAMFPTCLQRIAALLLDSGAGRVAEAVALLSAADAFCTRTGITCYPQDQRRAARAIERGQALLADHVFDHAWAAGQAMALDEAIANALEWLTERD